METDSYQQLCDALLPIVLQAGRVQLRYARSGFSVTEKSDKTPVTLADQESEAILLGGLAAIAPDVPVIAEEAMAAGQRPAIGERFFLVDPLDGTREFIAGRPEFTINIAFVVGQTPRFGLIYAPAAGRFFVTPAPNIAVEATLDVASPVTRLADVATRRIATRQAPTQGLVAIASRSHMTDATTRFLDRFPVSERRSAGSSLKFCLIARGDADMYPRIGGKTCEWDIAAGHAILAAAGGAVTTPDGAPLQYGKSAADFVNTDYVAWGQVSHAALASHD